MYGLVHAVLLWSKTFSAELAARGFEQCQADPCVFRRVLRGKVVVIIVVYVDDLLVASKTQSGEEQAINYLPFCSLIKGLGEAIFFLGSHIMRDCDAGTLKLDQQNYVRTIASKFNVEKTITTSAVAGVKPLSKDRCPTDRGRDERNAYHPLPGGGRGPYVGCDHDPP